MKSFSEDLKDLVFRFRDYIFSEKKLSDNTNYSYYNDILQFYEYLSLIPEVKGIRDFFKLEIIDDYIIYLANKEMTGTSINRKLSSVSLFFKFLKIEGIIDDNPSYLVDRPKKGERLPIYITLDEIEKILNAFSPETKEGIRDRALFELTYSCGLRVSEISNLDLGSVFFRERLLRVFGKGDKERYVPIGEKAASELSKYLKESRPFLVKKNKPTNALFLNYRGERLVRKGIWKNLKTALKIANVRNDFTVHSFRHSFATHLIQNGADLRGVQDLLGHKNISTTEIYTHLDLGYLREVYDKFHNHK